MTKLTDLCDIQYGYAFDSGAFTDDESYPQLVRIRDVKRGYSETYYNGEYPEEYVLSAGDLLIGMDGEFNIARWKVDGALLNQRVCKIIAKDNADEEFLRFALSKALKAIEDRTSFATVKHLSAKELNKLEIPVPPYEEQKKISEILHRLENVIDIRQNELASLDELIKARFVEMFGSIKSNDKGWDTVQLKDIADVRGRVGWKGYKKEDLRELGPLVLGATHLTDSGELDLSAPVYLSREKYEESPEIVLQKNDLIFTQRGNTIGKVGFVAEDIGEATINPCVLILRPLNIQPVYFKTYFVMDETKDDMWMLNSGSAQPMITQKGIGEYQLMIPPIEIQNQFAEFVKQVDKSKVAVKKALDETKLLFDSLMQEYFG